VTEAEIRAAEQDCARLIAGYCQAADCDDVEAFIKSTGDGAGTTH